MVVYSYSPSYSWGYRRKLTKAQEFEVTLENSARRSLRFKKKKMVVGAEMDVRKLSV